MDVIFMVFHHLNVIYIYNLSMNGCDLHGVSPPKCYIYTTCRMNGCDLHGASPPKCYIYTTCL